MKSVLIDARESGTSTGRYIDKLLEYLHTINTSYKIIVLTKPKRVEFINKVAPKFKVISSRYKEFTFGEQIGLLRQINKLKPDLVHFGMAQQPIMYRGRVVTTMHDLTTVRFRNPDKNWLVFVIKQQIYKWVNKIVARKSAAIITPSEFVKDDVARFADVNSRKIVVTYEAADQITVAPEPIEALEGSKFMLYVGRSQPHKNLERLIHAYAKVKESQPELKLVLVGKKDHSYKRLEAQAKNSGIEGVIFTDYVSEGSLRWLYENALVYVFPSLSEGFGLPGLEAMMHGCPLASSNATCLPEIYGDAAAYFDPLNIAEMTAVIERIITNPAYANKLRTLGREQVVKYSWKRLAEQTLTVYAQALTED